jgi:L-ascorbate metabolism protein UlaG (beta-lactamase superfamily)
MLVDFGRNYKPWHGGNMEQVARSIKARTNSQLDVLLVTHRHEDHLSAFGSKTVAKLIGDCQPKLIVRSWTEDPDAAPDLNKPGFGIADRQYVEAIHGARGFMGQLAGGFRLDSTTMGKRLKFLASTEYANETAVDQLRDWGKPPNGDAKFLHVKKPLKIDALIPDVEFEVLGPPLPTLYPKIAKQVSDHDKEFWHLWAQRVPRALEGVANLEANDPALLARLAAEATGGARRRSAAADTPGAIGPERWLAEKVRRQQVASLLRVVTWLDDVMNNTSVVLLITAGNRRLLFSGDAQLESWQWITVDSPNAATNRKNLAKVDLYKVGHHGSRNATPKTSLYGLWAPGGAPPRRVVSLMSTREEAYGESDNTFVPSENLKTGLSTSPMVLITTQQSKTVDDKILAYEVAASTTGSKGFEIQPPELRP